MADLPAATVGWRRAAHSSGEVFVGGAAACDVPAFVPNIAAETSAMSEPPQVAPIEIKLAGAIARVRPDTDVALLSAVLRAVRSSVQRS